MNPNTRIVLTRHKMTFEYIRVILTRCDQNMGRVLEYDQNIVTRGTVVVLSLDSTLERATWSIYSLLALRIGGGGTAKREILERGKS